MEIANLRQLVAQYLITTWDKRYPFSIQTENEFSRPYTISFFT